MAKLKSQKSKLIAPFVRAWMKENKKKDLDDLLQEVESEALIIGLK